MESLFDFFHFVLMADCEIFRSCINNGCDDGVLVGPSTVDGFVSGSVAWLGIVTPHTGSMTRMRDVRSRKVLRTKRCSFAKVVGKFETKLPALKLESSTHGGL